MCQLLTVRLCADTSAIDRSAVLCDVMSAGQNMNVQQQSNVRLFTAS